MCYKITLSKSHRQLIDWIGHRYAHGDDLCYALCESDDWEFSAIGVSDDEDGGWDSPGDITFNLSEPEAWRIRDILDVCLYDCASPSFIRAIRDFLEKIV